MIREPYFALQFETQGFPLFHLYHIPSTGDATSWSIYRDPGICDDRNGYVSGPPTCILWTLVWKQEVDSQRSIVPGFHEESPLLKEPAVTEHFAHLEEEWLNARLTALAALRFTLNVEYTSRYSGDDYGFEIYDKVVIRWNGDDPVRQNFIDWAQETIADLRQFQMHEIPPPDR